MMTIQEIADERKLFHDELMQYCKRRFGKVLDFDAPVKDEMGRNLATKIETSKNKIVSRLYSSIKTNFGQERLTEALQACATNHSEHADNTSTTHYTVEDVALACSTLFKFRMFDLALSTVISNKDDQTKASKIFNEAVKLSDDNILQNLNFFSLAQSVAIADGIVTPELSNSLA